MKVVTIIVRILLGLMFVVFGLNGFLHFIPMGAPPTGAAGQFFGAVTTTGYMKPIFLLQVVGGLLVLLDWVPLGLTILCPIIFNILLFHLSMAPSGIGMGALTALLALFLIWRYWANFRGLLQR